MESDRSSWHEAFRSQVTAELIARAERYASLRAGGVRQAGGVVDDLYVRELVQDVLTDTLASVVRWDPQSAELETHVFDVIRFRTRHHRARATRFPRISLDDCDDETRAKIEDALASTVTRENPERSGREACCLEALRLAARDDADVLALLDAYRTAETNKEVHQMTNMSERRYDNARKRLSRLVRAQRATERGLARGVAR